MTQNYHIFRHGELQRHENTLQFTDNDDKTVHLPVTQAEAIYLHKETTINTRLVDLLDEHNIELHMFNWAGKYVGSMLPTRNQTSGKTLVEQSLAYATPNRRLAIAKEIIQAGIHNMHEVVQYYDRRQNHDFDDVLSTLDNTHDTVLFQSSIEEVMGVEATARKAYYTLFQEITPEEFSFPTRSYNPPGTELNALISFLNALLYSTVTSAINSTSLEPAVSYVHEPGERRFSLALDLADIFKPVFVGRLALRLVNRGQISIDDFQEDLGGCLLAESGRKVVVEEYEKLLEETVQHERLNRKVSYQHLIQLEVYGLKKHILTGEEYTAFRKWW